MSRTRGTVDVASVLDGRASNTYPLNMNPASQLITGCIRGTLFGGSIHAAVRQESFDREPPNWEAINHRGKFFEPKTVAQDFGHSPASSRAGGQPGVIGGPTNPASKAASDRFALPRPRT